MVKIGPENCDCNQPEPTPSNIPVEQIGLAAAALKLLYMIVTKRPPPSTVPAPRLIGWGAEQWLKRFDIEDDQLLAYKAKLLDEPKQTKATTLPNRL